MTVREIITSGRDYNLHSHTQYCDGKAPMAEMAAAAAACGMKHYAFTPHCPTGVESGCNMRYSDVGAYLAECRRLRAEYADRMEIYAGMEIDYISTNLGPHCSYYADLPLDVRIGSVHFVPTQRGVAVDCDGSAERFARNLRDHFRGDVRYVVEKYYEQVLTMLGFGGFDILGHFDKIAANASSVWPGIEDTGWYDNLMTHVIDQIVASGVTVEINTKAYHRSGRFFPAVRWWPRLVSEGVALAVDSDAHHPDLITAGRAEAFQILETV